ncbi:MAG: hypothetical protein JST52_11120 [Bacteroidetes bacterium]|nr:hypothetical protein [Bacteroidota bacterium]
MKKFESLKSSKFEAFKSNVLTNLFSIVGGRCYTTLDKAGNKTDSLTDARTHDLSISNVDGSDPWRGDKETTTCPCNLPIGDIHPVIVSGVGEAILVEPMCE